MRNLRERRRGERGFLDSTAITSDNTFYGNPSPSRILLTGTTEGSMPPKLEDLDGLYSPNAVWRRKVMLRPGQDGSSGLAVPAFRMVGWCGVCLAFVLLSPVYGFGQDIGSSKTPRSEKPAPLPECPPFDLTYVPPDAIGVIALRPSAIFHDPAMKPLARLANRSLLMEMLLPYIPSAE
jgi:hypothetical protein